MPESGGAGYRFWAMIGFTATMPAVYERLYSPEEVAQHAEIVARRSSRLVHAEVWHSARGPLLCVIADDQPGFLALVTDTLLAQGWTIRGARAFCRQVSEARLEAVDFLEVYTRGANGEVCSLDGDALADFVRSLTELLHDELMQRSARAPEVTPANESPRTRVYFEREPADEGRYLLVVDAPDSDGLLHAVTSALHTQGLRIVACEIRTVSGRACDRFEVEPIARSSLRDSELCDVQLAILETLPGRR